MNEASGFTEFGGHLLEASVDDDLIAAIGADAPDPVATLASLGIEEVEQLVAVAAIPAVRSELQQVLGLQEQPFREFLERVRSVLPAARAAELNVPRPKDLGLGVRAPTDEMMRTLAASVTLEAEPAVDLPGAVNLIPYFQSIRNQGPRGTCVAFTLTALNEYIRRRRGLTVDLSEQDIYYETKLIDGSSSSCGTWQSKGVTVLSSRGQCREAVWHYLNALPCNHHGVQPVTARPDGLNYRLATLAVPVRSVASYKLNLSKQRPVTLSFPVYNSWYQSAATRQTGRITMRIGNEPSIGGHAVCLVGYVDTPTSPGGGYFIVRNSWGTAAFGSANPYGAGYGTIPYQYITNDAWEAYTAVVPGINRAEDADAEDTSTDDHDTAGESNVTIDVGSTVKITITSR